MKIALLSPTFPPKICGVGDHGFQLASALLAQGHEVTILTEQKDSLPPADARLEIFPDLLSAVDSKDDLLNGYDLVLMQYTPYIYAPESLGIRLKIPSVISRARKRTSAPFWLIAHELHYPVSLSPRGLLVGLPQALQFHWLVSEMDRIVFTYAAAETELLKFRPNMRKRLSALPVGSNIRVAPNDPLSRSRLFEKSRIPAHHRILFHFGGSHPTHLFEHRLAALREAVTTLGKDQITLVHAGQSQDEVEKKLGHSDLKESVRGLGKIPEQEVSLWLQNADVVLAPFMDGISTRRGSAMAAFAHGKAVLTTSGHSTTAETPWADFCRLTPVERPEAFTRSAVELLSHPTDAKKLGAAARAFYQSSFSWDSIARRLIGSQS